MHDKPITIRTAAVNDISLLTNLIRTSFKTVAEKFDLTPQNCPKHPSNLSEDWIENDFKRKVKYYILEENGQALGCVALEHASSDLCYLERLAVLPQAGGKGCGRSLVEHVMTEARNSGAAIINIGIIAHDTDLQAWYEKLGFILENTRDFVHLPFQVTFMSCALKP